MLRSLNPIFVTSVKHELALETVSYPVFENARLQKDGYCRYLREPATPAPLQDNVV